MLAALLIGAPDATQNTGIISDTIIDNAGQVVPDATITLVSEATADSRTTSSATDGAFVFRAGEPGSYTVKVELGPADRDADQSDLRHGDRHRESHTSAARAADVGAV